MKNFVTEYEKGNDDKTLIVKREFNAPIETVWRAWTEPKLIDKWWAPKPWKAETNTMDFRIGGSWLYSMNGPAGEKHWGRNDYTNIIPHKRIEGEDVFCDENGVADKNMPAAMKWKNEFFSTPNGTKVIVTITFASVEDLEKIVEMGFEEGFAMAHGNLDELLAI